MHYATRYHMNLSGEVSRKSNDFIVEPTEDTPFIKYSNDDKTLTIKGSSMRPDIHTFYHPFTSKAWTYLDGEEEFKLYFFFKELNASTAKVLFDIFKKARLKVQSGSQVEIYWGSTASNVDMLQTGKDFAEIYELNFQYVVSGE